MSETNRKPAIRFQGFTDVWEQRKLSSIYRNIRNAFVGTATPYYVPDGHFYLESNNVKNGQINRNSEVYINDDFYYQQKDKWLRTNDMVMVQSGHVGHAAVIPENLDKTVAHALIMFTDQIEETEPYFLNFQYQTAKAIKKISDITKGNTIKHILSSDMQNFVVDVPSLGEQKQIARFFQQLDNLITLHQRKYDKLKNIKKSMLEKMFPKNGSNVPEIRFKGFTDAWEQRKLGECFSERVESDLNGELISVTISSGIRKFSELGRHDNSNEDKSKYKKVSVGDIAYNSMRMWQGASGYSPYNGIVSPAYTVITPFEGIDSKFFAYLFKCEDMIHTFQIRSQGITSDTWNLKFPALSQIDVLFPADIVEQKAISNYLSVLDNIITLHQRKLEKLKNIKKSMLEKMFI